MTHSPGEAIGSSFECCFCSYQCDPSELLPVGVHGRLAICPNCRSFDRERVIFLFLGKHTNLFSGAELRLLHFAPEKNLRAMISAQSQIKYTTADIDKSKADDKQDITKLTYPNDHFDAVICVHVLEHVPDEAHAIRELLRVLRPGGWGLILVPIESGLKITHEDPTITDPEERLRLFGQHDHVRRHGADYHLRLSREGFHVNIHPFDTVFTRAEYEKYRLLTRDDMYIAKKPIDNQGSVGSGSISPLRRFLRIIRGNSSTSTQ